MYCARCGTAITSPAAFCSNCGAPLPAMAPAGASPGGPAYAAAPAMTSAAAPAAAVAGIAEYAGFWRRFWAFFIDSCVLMVVMIPIRLIIAVPMFAQTFSADDISPETIVSAMTAGFAIVFFSTLVNWIYFAYMESSVKQATLGKMALGIRVTGLDGRRISFARATGRFFAHIVTGLTLLIGYLIQPFTDRRQTLHDMIAKTLVLRGSPQ